MSREGLAVKIIRPSSRVAGDEVLQLLLCVCLSISPGHNFFYHLSFCHQISTNPDYENVENTN